jgi:DNA-binding transcriptional LysR family regulator
VLHGLKFEEVYKVSHVIVVPDRIAPRRGLVWLKQAMLECPHAAMPAGSPTRQTIDRIVKQFGERFEPQLECDSEAQCAAAVRTGSFAAVLPLWAWDSNAQIEHTVFEDPGLAALDTKLLLVWHSRLIQTRPYAGDVCRKFLAALLDCAAAKGGRA